MLPRSEWKQRQPGRPRRYEVLREMVDRHGWTAGAELGMFDGRTSFYLLDHCPSLSMIGVDVFEPNPDKIGRWEFGEDAHMACPFNQYLAEIYKRVDRDYPERCTVIKGDTVYAASVVPDNSLDFIFCDSCHSYDHLLAEIRAWAPKIKDTGYFTGHDIFFETVELAVREAFGKDWEETTNHVWYAKKCDLKL